MKKNNVFICIFVFALLIVPFKLIHTAYPNELGELCVSLFEYGKNAVKVLYGLETFLKSCSIYKFVAKTIIGIVIFALGLISIKLFPNKMLDMATGIYTNIVNVIKFGLIYIFGNLILITMFLNSLVGIAIAGFLVVMSIIISFLGIVIFILPLGTYLQNLYNGNYKSIFLNYIVGFLAISVSCNIYGFSMPMFIFVLPVLGSGSFFLSLYNTITKRHFYTEDIGFKKEHFDRNKIRDIITKDIK